MVVIEVYIMFYLGPKFKCSRHKVEGTKSEPLMKDFSRLRLSNEQCREENRSHVVKLHYIVMLENKSKELRRTSIKRQDH